ncbi:mitochondrial protein [Schizopora paradoxa]|uniref:trimethyllysine dioxygenase n=1 Tax=Schizopora paradoxa TaxID=27342 RepID=A0A0H2S034_9AGAM|nr:mitochondrial protein [Schizopora paradoxa]
MSATVRVSQIAQRRPRSGPQVRLTGLNHSKTISILSFTTFSATLTALSPRQNISCFQSRRFHSSSSSHSWAIPSVQHTGTKIQINWDSSSASKFHNFWLRDHCRCPKCFHSVTKQRLVNTFEIPPDIAPASVSGTSRGLEVIWDLPSHKSFYDWEWLKSNSYDPLFPEARSSVTAYGRISSNVKLWGRDIESHPPTVTHDSVMEDDKGLFDMLEKIVDFGFCFIKGVDATPQATEELTMKIGNIRHTQYGGFWDFTSDLAKGDTAYTTLALQAHTDTTYFTDPCGLQLFHLLSHTNGHGGESLLVDGFHVASLLHSSNPEAFDILTRVRVPTHAAGEPGAFYSSAPGNPIINLGHGSRSKDVVQIRYNNDDRSVMKDLKSAELEKWYDALRLWDKHLKDKDVEYWVQLQPGTAVVVDNHRVLHGRSAFTGKRRMCGAYVGMDDFLSKFTVLSEKFSPDNKAGRNIWSPLL